MNYSDKSRWIGKDFQGWPICKLTFKELLDELGLVDENGEVHIKSDNPILDVFPIRVRDDGMGYGIDDQYFISASYTDEKIIFFTEKYDENSVKSI